MSNSVGPCISLEFALDAEDGWPPVATESLPFQATPNGFVALVPPLFIKNLSVGDTIHAHFDGGSRKVVTWEHVATSEHTTIWLLRLRHSNTIEPVLAELRALGCNTVGLDELGVYAIDVPESVAIEPIDDALASLDADAVAIAFPSMRHPE